MSDLNGELLTVLATASEERKAEALRVLRGEVVPGAESDSGPEPYLTLREVGRRLSISACSLWRWGVPGHELGGRRRFRISEVQEYLESDAFKRRAEALKQERRGKTAGAESKGGAK